MWSYAFFRTTVYILCVGLAGVLLFVLVSSVIVRKRLHRAGRKALSVADLNAMSHRKGGE